MARVFIGLGSNLGDRRTHLAQAITALRRLPGTNVVRLSSLWETEPHGDLTRWFVNAVAEIATSFDPRALLDALLGIETAMGRRRGGASTWENRVIDLDILFYDEATVDTPGLRIPHPALHHRRFVLAPLAEIAPGLRHPTLGQTIATLLATVADEKRVVRMPDPPGHAPT